MYDLYAIFKQAHPPSAVEHCAVCKFFSSTENNLVVAGISLIRVYRLVDYKVSREPENACLILKYLVCEKQKPLCVNTGQIKWCYYHLPVGKLEFQHQVESAYQI